MRGGSAVFPLLNAVWLAESLFPTEAKAAMNNANVDGTLRFKSSCLTNLISGNKRSAEDVVKASFKMTEKDFSRMEALTKTGTFSGQVIIFFSKTHLRYKTHLFKPAGDSCIH